jgi:Tfp pilus assembly protein PilF
MHALAGEAAAKRIYVLSRGAVGRRRRWRSTRWRRRWSSACATTGRLKALLHNNLGVAYTLKGEYKQAQERYERTATLLQSRPGPPDPLLAATFHNLGELSVKQGKLDIARQRFTQAREQFVKDPR